MLEATVDLSTFVDRVMEIDGFCRMLGNVSKPIMVVWGESEIGKTHLVYKMVQECGARRLVSLPFLWNQFTEYDSLELMLLVRDQIGPKHFRKFTALEKSRKSDPRYVLEVVSKGRVSVGDRANISGKVNRMTGVVVEQPSFTPTEEQMAEAARLRKTRMMRLTDAFIKGLAQAAKKKPIVIFFDPLERISLDTQDWIWGGLFRSVIESRLQNVKFVICGQQQPHLTASYVEVVEERGLKPFERMDIVEYLRLRFQKANVDVTDRSLDDMALGIFSCAYPSARNPGFVFKSSLKLIEEYQRRIVPNDG
jgi:hypothetical protein